MLKQALLFIVNLNQQNSLINWNIYNEKKEMFWSKVLYEGALQVNDNFLTKYRLMIKVPRKGSKRATDLVDRFNNF